MPRGLANHALGTRPKYIIGSNPGGRTVAGDGARRGSPGSESLARGVAAPYSARVQAHTFSLRSRRTVTPRGIEDAVVLVREGRIAEVRHADGAAPRDAEDLGHLVLMPGLVDSHVHINEPGRAEWEGFETATRAAAAGGVTTIVDMPLNSVPATTTAAALGAKRAAAAGKCSVDVAFWGGVVPGNAGELEALAAEGVRGFKCFLVASGVDEFPHIGERDLRAAMPVIARLGLPLLVHAELPGPIEAAARVSRGRDPRAYATWLASRPPAAECEAIALMLRLCGETGCRVHIVHLTTADALPMLREARRRGLPVTVETCPHYLGFAAEDVADGATAFKCAPPIRERASREALWAALAEGTIDLVATDHSPCPPAMKRLEAGDFLAAWGGIASLELSLAAVWTEARARGFTFADLARWMSGSPSRLAGLDGAKGAIAPGCDADLVAWDPGEEWIVNAAALHQRHKLTPYAGRGLAGRVRRTYVRGVPVCDGGRLTDARPGRIH
jgi:allantoinase